MGARNILVQGPSGTGKSTSWENIPHTEAYIITPNAKQLPFRGSAKKYNAENKNIHITNKLTDIPALLKGISEKMPHIKYILLEDYTHYQNARMMDDAFMANKGFDKWNTFGKDIYRTITGTTEGLRSDLTIVYNSHVEQKENGDVNFKSSGKLLDNTIDVVSYFTYVLHTDVLVKGDTVEYRFLTNTNGSKQAKTPRGCFDSLYVPNDVMSVIAAIDKYENAE